MTGLLVSVRNAVEAQQAMAGGAAIIDVKEPTQGSLGAAPLEQWNDVVDVCHGKSPVSLALGELMDPELPDRLTTIPDVAYAKFGLAGCRQRADWIPRWRWAIRQLPPGTSPVAVNYVDAQRAQAPTADVVRQQAERWGCRAMLWDTFDKTSGNLLQQLTLEALAAQVTPARHAGMLIVLAGSLQLHDVPELTELAPDFIAIRGAACEGPRTGHVRQELVKQFASRVAAMAQH